MSIMSLYNQESYSSERYLLRGENGTQYIIESLGQGSESSFTVSCLQADFEAIFYPHAATRLDGLS